MTFMKRRDGSLPFSNEIKKTLLFVPEDLDQGSLRGVLHLRPELSCSTLSKDNKPDSIDMVAFPVPDEHKYKQFWKILPGAKKAFVTGKVDNHDDVETLVEWCQKHGDFTEPVLDQVRAYLEKNDSVKSFVSFPLVDTAGQSFAVLNVHSNKECILGPSQQKRDVFHAMIAPFLYELANALRLLLIREETCSQQDTEKP